MTYWQAVTTPPPQMADRIDQKDSFIFPGTHMKFKIKQQQFWFLEITTEGPAGIIIPPMPTGKGEWRDAGPRTRIEASIHMTPVAIINMKEKEQLFSDIMANFTAGTAFLFYSLGRAVYRYGLDKAKNADGGLDILITLTQATAGGNLILLPSTDCIAIIQNA